MRTPYIFRFLNHISKFINQRKFSTSITSSNDIVYKPVMSKEVLTYLNPKDDQVIIDMTFGAGGHTDLILSRHENVKIIALDRDSLSYQKAHNLTLKYPGRIIPILGKFSELPNLMKLLGMGCNSIDGIIFEFGCSTIQLDMIERGFSVDKNGKLDMRMDGDRVPNQITAKDVLTCASQEHLAKIFKVYGGDKNAQKIANSIVESKYMFRKLETTYDLRDLVNSTCKDIISSNKNTQSQSVLKIFQALRMFVNDELNEINQAMFVIKNYLKIGGKVVTISFNTLEDTIVKRHINSNIINNTINPLPLKYSNYLLVHNEDLVNKVMENSWESLTKHVIVPSLDEVEYNSLNKNAKLRAAVKIR